MTCCGCCCWLPSRCAEGGADSDAVQIGCSPPNVVAAVDEDVAAAAADDAARGYRYCWLPPPPHRSL